MEWQWAVGSDGVQKTLRLVCGDLTELQGPCDVVVCSAHRNEYFPTEGTLLFSLMNKGYYVWELAERPEEGLRFADGWISRGTGMDFKRIACIELLEYEGETDQPPRVLQDNEADGGDALLTILKKSFSTLRYLLEQAAYSGIPVRKLAMTIPGSGRQGIRLCYILAPMIAHCRFLLESDTVDEISIYTLNRQDAEEAAAAFRQAFSPNRETPEVFISYSSRQTQVAHEICRQIRETGVSCWIAPESIPEGSSYQELIPEAISSAKVVVLVLSPDAVRSRWVQKEIGSAIGADKMILPYQLTDFEIGRQFMFLLDGEQIMRHREEAGAGTAHSYQDLTGRIREYLGK